MRVEDAFCASQVARDCEFGCAGIPNELFWTCESAAVLLSCRPCSLREFRLGIVSGTRRSRKGRRKLHVGDDEEEQLG